MMEACAEIVEEGLVAGIKATIELKLSSKYTREEIDLYINNFIEKSGFIPEEIKKIGIIVSYDMERTFDWKGLRLLIWAWVLYRMFVGMCHCIRFKVKKVCKVY